MREIRLRCGCAAHGRARSVPGFTGLEHLGTAGHTRGADGVLIVLAPISMVALLGNNQHTAAPGKIQLTSGGCKGGNPNTGEGRESAFGN
jgi:hypothetical protein